MPQPDKLSTLLNLFTRFFSKKIRMAYYSARESIGEHKREIVVYQVDEKLAAPRVGPGVGHADGTAIVLVLAVELVLDGITRSPTARAGRVSALNHEAVYDAVKDDSVIKSLLYQLLEVS